MPASSNTHAAEPAASVIVPFRNAGEGLRVLLDCLRAQTYPRDRFEVLFVDDASTDDCADELERELATGPGLRPWARLLRHPARRGSYAARNSGIEISRAPAFAFTDADCRPDAEWLERGLATLDDAPRAAGWIELERTDESSVAEMIDASRFLRQAHYVREGFGATANLFVRREVFDAAGLFDSRIFSGGDHEFGQRAERAGFAIVLAKDAVVRHSCRTSFRALFRKAERVGYGFGQVARLRGTSLSEFAARAGDRLTLGSGRELRARQQSAPRGPRRLLLAAGHLAMGACTAAGVLRGYLTTRPRSA
jgi:glycosyltransferase involved in cell wall biosynthesis